MMDIDIIKQHLRRFTAENLIKGETAKEVEDHDSFFEKERNTFHGCS